MKRNWKRILSLWLTVCMVFTMNFGFGAAAVYAFNGEDALDTAKWAVENDDSWDSDGTDKLEYTSGTKTLTDSTDTGAEAKTYNLTMKKDAYDITLTTTKSGTTFNLLSENNVENMVKITYDENDVTLYLGEGVQALDLKSDNSDIQGSDVTLYGTVLKNPVGIKKSESGIVGDAFKVKLTSDAMVEMTAKLFMYDENDGWGEAKTTATIEVGSDGADFAGKPEVGNKYKISIAPTVDKQYHIVEEDNATGGRKVYDTKANADGIETEYEFSLTKTELDGWTIKKGESNDRKDLDTRDATVEGSKLTIKQDIDNLWLTAGADAEDITVDLGEKNVTVNLAGANTNNKTPKVIFKNPGSTANLKAGDEDTVILKAANYDEETQYSDFVVTIDNSSNTGAIADDDAYIPVTVAAENPDAEDVFEAEEGLNTFSVIPDDSYAIAASNLTEVNGIYTLAENAGETEVYIFKAGASLSGPYKVTPLSNTGKSLITDGLEALKATNVTTNTASMNIAGIGDVSGKFDIYVSANTGGVGVSTNSPVTLTGGTGGKVGFTDLTEGTVYDKVILVKRPSFDANKFEIGYTLEQALAQSFTTKGDADLSDLYVNEKPYSINISANHVTGITYYAIVVSANKPGDAEAIAESRFDEDNISDGYTAIQQNETGTNFEKAVKDAEGNEGNIIPTATYYVYAVSANTSGIKNTPVLIETIGPRDSELPSFDLNDLEGMSVESGITYAGHDVGISENFIGIEDAKKAEEEGYGDLSIKVTNSYDPEMTLEQNFTAASILYDALNFEGTKGWPANENYVAIAQFVGDEGYYGANNTITVSAPFAIAKKDIKLQPVLKLATISANKALGDDYKPDNFGYEVYKDEKKVDYITLDGALDDKYVFTTVSGEVITPATKFPEGDHEIYISENETPLVCTNGDDPESYNIISEHDETGALSATLKALVLQTPTIDATDKELYYYAYTQMTKMDKDALKKEMAKYVKVTMGSTNITEDTRLEFLYWDSVNKQLKGEEDIPETLSANDYIFVSGNYIDGTTKFLTSDYATIKINAQPIGIVGTTTQGNERNAAKQDDKYDITDNVEIYTVSDNGKLQTNLAPIWSGKLSKISEKAFDIDIAGVDNTKANTYKNLTMTWDSTSLNSAKVTGSDALISYFAKNYKIDSANTYVQTYSIDPVLNITVIDATDGSVLSSNKINGEDKLYSYKGYESESTATQFAVSFNRAEPSFRFAGINYVPNNEAANGHGYVYTFNFDNVWSYVKNVYKDAPDIEIYAYYQDKAANSSGTVTVAPITPVYYTGYKHVTTDTAFKKAQSNDIDLYVTTVDGAEPLTQDVDYKVSYKNNTNAGYASDKKAPQVIIKGIGQYKGLKITANFTILPEKFGEATPTLKTKYVPLTKKGVLKLGETIKFRTKKVNKSFYTLSYRYAYDAANEEADIVGNTLTQGQLAAAYEGTKALHLNVYATSVNPKGKKVNFSIGDTLYMGEIYAYPKGSKTLKVKLANKGKVAYSSSKTTLNVSDIIDGKNETITVGKTTVSKDMLDADQLEFYSDKNFTKPVGTSTTNTGTYYLMVVPNEKSMATTGVYKPAAVKVQFTGEKLTKKLISFTEKKKAANGTGAQTWTLATSLTEGADKDFEAYLLDAAGEEGENGPTLTKTTNGYTFDPRETYDSARDKLIDNGKGTYTVVIEGRGKYSGKLNLKYTYTKGSLKGLGFTGIQVNGGKAVAYDPSEGDAKSGTYQQMTLTILSANNAATTYSGKKGEDGYGTLDGFDEIKSIDFSGSSIGKNKGKVTITFKNYSGKLTGKFDIEQVAVDSTNIRKASIYKGEKSAQVFLAQKIDGVDYAFKKGTDYKLSNFSVLSDTTGQVTIDITSKGRIKGSSMTTTFPIYQNKVTDIKIAALSENGKGNEDSATVSYNSTGKFYEYQGTSAAVMPKVDKVTAKVDGKETTIPASYYDVTYAPVTNADGDYVKGTYKVYVTLNASGGSTYPSYTTVSSTYKVSQALK